MCRFVVPIPGLSRNRVGGCGDKAASRSLLIIGFGELVVLGVVGLVGACGVGVLGRLMAVAGFFGGGGRVLGF